MVWNYHEKLTAMASPTPPDALPLSTVPKLVPPRPTAPPTSFTRPAQARPSGDPTTAVEAAIDATQRTSTSLSSLLDTLGRFTSGINGAQEASEQLKHELFMLREMLGTSNQESLALKVKVDNLERQLEEARSEGVEEQRYIRDEQDRFIAALMEEYEMEIEHLKRALTGTSEPVNPTIVSRELQHALEAVEVAEAERQHSRELAHRAHRQRDSAQREVTRLEHELRVAQAKFTDLANRFDDQHTRPTEPPPNDAPTVGRPLPRSRASHDTDPAPRSATPQGLELKPHSHTLDLADFERDWDAAAIPAPPPAFEEASPLATAMTEPALRHSAPPAELQAALTSTTTNTPSPLFDNAHLLVGRADETPSIVTNMRPSSVYPDPYRVDSKPPLKRKPDHTQRPLVGYSKRADEIQPEQLGGSGVRNADRDRDRDSR